LAEIVEAVVEMLALFAGRVDGVCVVEVGF
jgi:hypothetical protein